MRDIKIIIKMCLFVSKHCMNSIPCDFSVSNKSYLGDFRILPLQESKKMHVA